MERYIKANQKVVEFLHLQNDRTKLKDGNFILWIQDLIAFGQLINLSNILSQIGAIAMDGKSAADEQNGVTCQQLPLATDERFRVNNNKEA